jgi:glycosyltransferase involved in cell wall biosynthesis
LSQALVTIGITTYNAAETLERAIESALSQTWKPVEIIIVDDCSTDSTGALLKRLAHDFPQVRILFNTTNGGVAIARNKILDEARGDFVVFFDDDDESFSDRIEKQVRRIVKYEEDFGIGAPVICHTARTLIYPDGARQVVPTMGQDESRVAPFGINVARRILLGRPLRDGYGGCPTCSQMARLSTYRSLGGFDSSLRRSEDTDLNIRLALAGGHFVGIAEPLVTQFMTKTNEKSLAEEYRNVLLLMQKHQKFMKGEGQYEFCLEWLAVKQHWLEGSKGNFLQSLAVLALTKPWQTSVRLIQSLRSISINLTFSRFHRSPADSESMAKNTNRDKGQPDAMGS